MFAQVIIVLPLYLFSIRFDFAERYPGVKPPPIPSSISFEQAAMFPKYFPSKTTCWNMTQQIRRDSSQPSDLSESDHIYAQLKLMSGGLESGETRAKAPRSGQRIDVVFYQKQDCKCQLSAARLGAVCTKSASCNPFLVVFNGTDPSCTVFFAYVAFTYSIATRLFAIAEQRSGSVSLCVRMSCELHSLTRLAVFANSVSVWYVGVQYRFIRYHQTPIPPH